MTQIYAVSGPPDEIARDVNDRSTDHLPDIVDLVQHDLIERKAEGIRRYGVPLRPWGTPDSLKETYLELLDAVIYLRELLYERDNPSTNPGTPIGRANGHATADQSHSLEG